MYMESPRTMGKHGEDICRSTKPKSSFLAALDRTSKWTATAVVGGVMLWRGDGLGMWAAVGALVNWGLSVWLKELINQPRPFPAKKSDPGMPSTHSQSLFYGFAILTLSVAEVSTNNVAYAVGGFATCFSSYLAWLRVRQRYHTRNQVVIGALLGSLFCAGWLYAWTMRVSRHFQSYVWVRGVVVLGAIAFWIVLFKTTIATFGHTKIKDAITTQK